MANGGTIIDYQLIDSGAGRKIERFGKFTIERPCGQALWKLKERATDAQFDRDEGWNGDLPDEWEIELDGLKLLIRPTDFGHLGFFPEHLMHLDWLKAQKGKRILNLFAYTGLLSIALAKTGAQVTHVDASKKSVSWAADNAKLNGVEIRWIVDDAIKFLMREKRRGITYDGIILDPPSFGRGPKGEVFKIEEKIELMIDLCQELAENFLLFSCHTPGMTPVALGHLFNRKMETGEMVIPSDKPLPSGSYARWSK
ncbi:MAG: class I SAM-dependent methyltransferase [Simkaniaceae bacterium]|nr:class I SAM-dependent methyltransferase [Simkaniaceae bacterium]